MALRRQKKTKSGRSKKPTGMRSGVIPYGFAYLDGKLVVDPREYKVVFQIVRLWQSGKSFTAIAKILNEQNIPTRLGKKWAQSVVGSVIKRHLNKNKNP